MARLGEHLLHFVFPITCSVCGRDLPADDYYRICMECMAGIKLINGTRCRTCGVPLPDGGAHCYDCRVRKKRMFALIRSAGVYEGPLRKVIHKFKYTDRDYLKRFLGALLVDAIRVNPELAAVDVVVPVPLHWTKRLRRGYNQAELLAKQVCEYLQKPLGNVLVRSRSTRSQFLLGREDRARNIAGSFRCRDAGAVRRKTVLLVDDVCTTCATIDACARVLRDSGAKKVYGLTVARD
jgi:ComF family protein